MRALIIENNLQDSLRAAALVNKMGCEDVEAFTRVDAALLRLREALESDRPMPDLIILDLDFSLESGFEVLRFWKSSPRLQSARVVVWTGMGETEIKISRLFGVQVVPKCAGEAELEAAISGRAIGA
jgi:DNA-binding response OmpR family regulator